MFIGGTVLAAGIETNIIGLGSDTASSTIPIIDYTDRDNLIASSTIQEYINTISSEISTIQDSYFLENKKHFSCLTSSSEFPKNGTKIIPDKFDEKNNCQKESLSDLGLQLRELPFRFDIFENKTQVGKTIISGHQTLFFIEINGKKYIKSIDTGAENKTYDWKQY